MIATERVLSGGGGAASGVLGGGAAYLEDMGEIYGEV